METVTNRNPNKYAVVLIATAILVLIAVILVTPAKGDVFIYGSVPNYSAVTLPNNSYVHQGENITQGYYYDLSGIYGFSGKLAWWKNDDDAGYDDPDLIIDLEHPEKVFIGTSTFPVGRYFQWDGKTCDSLGLCSSFGHGNSYVFHVSPQPYQSLTVQEKTIVYSSNITIMQNGSEIQVPVTLTQIQTYMGTPAPTAAIGIGGTITVPTTEPQETTIIVGQPLNMDVQDQNGNPVIGGVGGAIPVTAKAPISITVAIIGIAVALFVGGKKE
jgi:hypothetical protein